MKICLLAGALLCAAEGAWAATRAGDADLLDWSLDDLLRLEVAGASGFAQPLAESPASVTVIAQDELREHGYRNLAEALSTVRGVHVSSDRNYTFIGVRGLSRPGDYNGRILLLTDGARRNEAVYDQAFVGNEAPVEIDWVKRLEFVPGPSSALYGGNALLGTVHAVLYDGADLGGTRLTFDAGSGRAGRVGVMSGARLENGAEWFLGLAGYTADGRDHHFPAYAQGDSDGWARGLDGEDYRKAYAKLRWAGWRLSGSYAYRDKAIPTAYFGTEFGVPGNHTVDTQGLIDLSHERSFAAYGQETVRIYAGHYAFDSDYRYADGADSRDEARARWWGGEYRIAWSGFSGHRLQLGVEARRNAEVWQRYFELRPFRSIFDEDHPGQVLGVFAQDEWRFAPGWLLNAGWRYDRHSGFAGQHSPRLALVHQPQPGWALKAVYGEAFRPPNAFERFYADGGDSQKGNPDLRPERVRSLELGVEHQRGIEHRLALSLYRNEVRDLIDQQVDPVDGVSYYANVATLRAQGIEIEAERRWAGGHRLRASLALQHTDMSDGGEASNAPRRIGRLVGALPLADGWRLSGEAHALSGRRSLTGRVGGGLRLNVSLLRRLQPGWGELALSIYNLTDRVLYDPVAIAHAPIDAVARDGRSLRLRWTLVF